MSAVLYVDFDGVLHHHDVRRWRGIGPVVATGSLFEHASVLIDILAPYPSARIVLSTSWVSVLGFNRTRAYLPEPLRRRVIGATTHSHMRLRAPLSRGFEVWEDVVRRGVHPNWVAIDDTDEGWTALSRPHLVLSDPERGLGSPAVAAALTDALARLAHGG